MRKAKIIQFPTLKVIIPIITFLIALSAAFSTSAQDNSEKFNLETITCWDVMLLEEEERAFAFILLLGYQSGKSNAAEISGEVIEEKLAKAVNFCESNPDSPAIASMSI